MAIQTHAVRTEERAFYIPEDHARGVGALPVDIHTRLYRRYSGILEELGGSLGSPRQGPERDRRCWDYLRAEEMLCGVFFDTAFRAEGVQAGPFDAQGESS